MGKGARFVKSADTRTPVANSKSEIDKMLRRYGASAISTSENIEKREVVVSFIIPNSPEADAQKVPVRLPVSIFAVYDALNGRPWRTDYSQQPARRVTDARCYDAKKMEQAERVAWRNLVLWIDAALSAANVGLQTITEAFFAHAVVGAGGERMIEAVEAAQSQLGVGVQRLLAATTEVAP